MLPVLIAIGPVKIYSMGVMMAIGMLTSLYWWWKMGRDEHWEEISLFDGYFLGVLGFFVVGRVGYALFSQEITGIWQGLSLLAKPGLNYFVGIGGAISAVFLFARAKEWDLWKVGDALGVSLSLAMVWGMIGTILNRGELLIDGWGLLVMIGCFGLTTIVRKNFRFYSWYKGGNSVAKDGLSLLTFLGMSSSYYIGRGIIVKSWQLAVVGGVGVVIVAILIWFRSGQTQLFGKIKRRKK